MKPLRALLGKRARTSTVEWCEDHIYLSPRIPTSEPGQWNRRNVAALCARGGPLEALDNPDIETVTVEKGSQTCLTTTAYAWLAHCLATDPAPALIAMNSTTDAREKCAESWRPLWEDSPGLKKFLPRNKRIEWTKLYQLCNGAPIYWMGANSAGRAGSKPIRRLILDEEDKYPQQVKRKKGNEQGHKEAGAAFLFRQRVKGYRKKGLAKVLEFSTPTTETGEIHQSYQKGDQRLFYVPCIHCGSMQIMVWQNFKMDMALAKTDPAASVNGARYECPACGKPWTDDDRWTAIASPLAEWRATCKPKDPKCWSGRLPSWCSSFVTVNYLVRLWISAQGSTSALQDFINSEMGEPYLHYENIIKHSVFSELEGEYKEGEMWTDVEPYKTRCDGQKGIVFGGVDVQKGYLMAAFRLFVPGGDSGLIWAGHVADFKELDALATRFEFSHVLVDSRYETVKVNQWCMEHDGYIPCMGVTRKKSPYTFDFIRSGSDRKMISFDPDQIKNILADLIQRVPGARAWLIPKGKASDQAYPDQMAAERCVNGKWIQVPAGRANHFWDSEALCILAAVTAGILKMNDQEEGTTP